MKKPTLRDMIWLSADSHTGGNYIGVYAWSITVNSVHAISLWNSIKNSIELPIIAAHGNTMYQYINELVNNDLEP
jgi:hypothetical protein